MTAPARIGIVGTGLIGAGFAALVARRAPNVAIAAVEPQGAYRETVAAQVPTVAWRHTAAELGDCDMVFLACPPGAVVDLAREVLEAGEALVIDFASVKGRIVEALADQPRFIGGHPLAGGNRPGPFGADPEALAGGRMVLTPHAGNAEADIERVEHFLAALGCTVLRSDARAHDQLLARSSHLPHLMAYGFARTLGRIDADELGAFASRSTRETSRFASANTRIWREIFEQNGEAVSAALDELILDLMDLRNAICGARAGQLAPLLEDAATRATALRAAAMDTDQTPQGGTNGSDT